MTHLQSPPDILLPNSRQQCGEVHHPVDAVVYHERVEVLQVENVSIKIGTCMRDQTQVRVLPTLVGSGWG